MLKKLAAGLVTATILGVGGLAAAGAVSSGTGSSTAPSSAPAAEAHPRAHHRHGRLVFLAKTAASAIGIEVSELRKEVKAGKTIAEVATANDVEPQAVVDAIVSAVNAKVDQAVTDGKIDAARATKIKARIPKLADRLVNHTQDVIARLRHHRHNKSAAS